MVPPLHGESEGTVEPGKLVRPEPLGLTFPQAHARHPEVAFYLIVQWHCVAPDVQAPGEGIEVLPGLIVHEL
jgi:hypothetical protein